MWAPASIPHTAVTSMDRNSSLIERFETAAERAVERVWERQSKADCIANSINAQRLTLMPGKGRYHIVTSNSTWQLLIHIQ